MTTRVICCLSYDLPKQLFIAFKLDIISTSKESEKLHIFRMSATKLKAHKPTGTFRIDGFQTPFRKDNDTNGGWGIIAYVRDYVNAKRLKWYFLFMVGNQSC